MVPRLRSDKALVLHTCRRMGTILLDLSKSLRSGGQNARPLCEATPSCVLEASRVPALAFPDFKPTTTVCSKKRVGDGRA